MFNEKEVVSGILKGKMRSFDLLVKQYERLVFYVVNRLTNEQQDIEDICQEVFIKVHKGLHKFQFESRLSTWIGRIAYLTAIDYVRKYRSKSITLLPDHTDTYHFTDETPESLLTQKDTAMYINHLISQLPIPYRTVLTLFHLNEFSHEEIEQITDMPIGTIKSNLFRARKLLKEQIQKDLKREAP